MLQQDLVHHYHHYLDLLQQEIEAYEKDPLVWAIVEGISNSGGNLCTHLLGNLNHFIGKNIGKTGYKRDRPLEFECIDVPRDQLIKEIHETKEMIEKVILAVDDLNADYANQISATPISIQHKLIHLIAHLSYHVGQINYHRRILEGATQA